MKKKQYSLASIGDRAGAFLFDGSIAFIFIILLFWFLISLPEDMRTTNSTLFAIIFFISILLFKPFYEVFCYIKFRKSLGKKIFGLQIVNNSMSEVSVLKLTLREVLKHLSLLIFQTVLIVAELITISINQRSIIDKLVGTNVVKVNYNLGSKWSKVIFAIFTIVVIVIAFFVWLIVTFSNT